MQCHEQHGSSHLSLLNGTYSITVNNKYVKADYQTCWSCHSEDKIINQINAFSDLHEEHVKDEGIPCVACHDVHGSYDKGEPGLINFKFAIQNGFDLQLDGRTLSTAFWIDGDKGNCYLICHEKEHDQKMYKRFGEDDDDD